jgi:hypothetical protein
MANPDPIATREVPAKGQAEARDVKRAGSDRSGARDWHRRVAKKPATAPAFSTAKMYPTAKG